MMTNGMPVNKIKRNEDGTYLVTRMIAGIEKTVGKIHRGEKWDVFPGMWYAYGIDPRTGDAYTGSVFNTLKAAKNYLGVGK